MTNITNLILRSNYLARQIGRMEQILKASPEGKLYLSVTVRFAYKDKDGNDKTRNRQVIFVYNLAHT